MAARQEDSSSSSGFSSMGSNEDRFPPHQLNFEYDEICLELLDVHLEVAINTDLPVLTNCYLRLFSRTTVFEVRRLVALKVLGGMRHYPQIEILCNGELLDDDFAVKTIYLTKWHYEGRPLTLQYRRKIID